MYGNEDNTHLSFVHREALPDLFERLHIGDLTFLDPFFAYIRPVYILVGRLE